MTRLSITLPVGRLQRLSWRFTFHPSLETQERVRYLLGRHKAGELTPQEVVELERFGELEHLMQLIKARAYLYAEQRL